MHLLKKYFVTYIADKLSSLCRLFADGKPCNYSDRDSEQITTVISCDLNELDKWAKT